MNYAIIAAGAGSRLAAEGVRQPKPLVEVGGECLIDRLIRIFMQNDAHQISVICNQEAHAVSRHLLSVKENGLQGRPVPLRFIAKSTPSSMHSLYELQRIMDGGPFVLTTVDTVFSAGEFGRFVQSFAETLQQGLDGLMGVTPYVDDERPLYVETTAEGRVAGFRDDSTRGCTRVSAGIYGLGSATLPTLRACVEGGESRLRSYQRALLRDGCRLRAYTFGKVFDIDHASDIAKAELFLARE
ncbi:NDP-sugar synthase [Prevotella sp. kh1p2]|uniref:nucleotidyltransferase family protein n=1 Tax=Prevotella sp. kh1p2 TaxID=1761883 RepID=UPI0008CDC361|nr:sugar phosphate nucleotidyltransferase [Prevotella sp. kh1p2]SES62828.1 Choline kinase [Prevotella sp. kh1p2]SNU10190.1 Choline kinase [Prevotellaceae bacterium KH2P17]